MCVKYKRILNTIKFIKNLCLRSKIIEIDLKETNWLVIFSNEIFSNEIFTSVNVSSNNKR